MIFKNINIYKIFKLKINKIIFNYSKEKKWLYKKVNLVVQKEG